MKASICLQYPADKPPTFTSNLSTLKLNEKTEKKRNKKGQNKQILRPIIPKITLTLKRKKEKKIGKEQGGRKEEAKAIMIIPFVSYIGDSFIQLLIK